MHDVEGDVPHGLLPLVRGQPTDGAGLPLGQGHPLLDAPLVEGVDDVLRSNTHVWSV